MLALATQIKLEGELVHCALAACPQTGGQELQAERLARALLQQSLPRRWAHVQGVAARARSLAPVLGADADLLEAAAWLHDIGYAPGLADTGLHARRGAHAVLASWSWPGAVIVSQPS
jgi:HD superfamily phosphodiesterase